MPMTLCDITTPMPLCEITNNIANINTTCSTNHPKASALQRLKNLAVHMARNGKEVGDLDENEQALQVVPVGNKKYNRASNKLLDGFFELIIAHTSEEILKNLCCTKSELDDCLTYDYNFFHLLSGEKEQWKQVIINKMMILYFLRRHNKRYPTKPLDASTFQQYAKQLFVEFHKSGIKYDMNKDFNALGEFHSIVVAKWKEFKTVDEQFATKSKATVIDENANVKFQAAMEDGTNMKDIRMLLTLESSS
jgi:hypothetical protein